MRIDPTAAGAFLSGGAAVISALLSSRLARRRALEDCERRISEIRQALDHGVEIGERHHHEDQTAD